MSTGTRNAPYKNREEKEKMIEIIVAGIVASAAVVVALIATR